MEPDVLRIVDEFPQEFLAFRHNSIKFSTTLQAVPERSGGTLKWRLAEPHEQNLADL